MFGPTTQTDGIISRETNQEQKELRGLGPRANYTD
jgi:hypothetical protein